MRELGGDMKDSIDSVFAEYISHAAGVSYIRLYGFQVRMPVLIRVHIDTYDAIALQQKPMLEYGSKKSRSASYDITLHVRSS